MLFGAHCSGGVKKALDNAIAMGAEAVQLFAQSPRTWRFPDHDPADLEAFRSKREEAGLPALVHALYLVNLAAPDDAIYSKSVDTMRATVDAACAIEADAVIFHVGSHLGAGFDTGLERAVPAIEQVLERCNERTWLLVENSAGAGGTIGRSLDELVRSSTQLGRHERLGVCLDSCHLFVSGVDVTDPVVFDALLDGPRRPHRPRSPARAARERRESAARIESRPPRQHRRRADRRRARSLPRASEAARTCPSCSRCRAPTARARTPTRSASFVSSTPAPLRRYRWTILSAGVFAQAALLGDPARSAGDRPGDPGSLRAHPHPGRRRAGRDQLRLACDDAALGASSPTRSASAP